MTAPGLSSLIERMEKATGGSRELDLECWWWAKATHGGQAMEPEYKAMNLKMNDAPRYTSDLNAALSLVPEGQWYCISGPHSTAGGRYGGGPKRFDAILLSPEHEGLASTPAIALTIAALKARLSSQREPTDARYYAQADAIIRRQHGGEGEG